MKNFNLIYQQYMFDTKKDQQPKKQYRSLEQFKHFCDQYNVLTKQLESNNNLITVNLFIVKNGVEKQFQYYYKFNPHYYAEFKHIFDALDNYKEKYIVTLDGTNKSKIVFWG